MELDLWYAGSNRQNRALIINSESTSTSLGQQSCIAAEVSRLPTRQEVHKWASFLSQDIQKLGDNTMTKAKEVETKMVRLMDRMKATMETSNSLLTSIIAQELRAILDDHFQEHQAPNVSSPATARMTLALTVPQLQISTKYRALLLRHFLTEVKAVLLLWFVWVCKGLSDIVLVLPQIISIITVLNRIPQAISLILRDNMSFEDAMGRIYSLPYQYFRYWPVFISSLRCTFTDLPGMQKVMEGRFVLTPENHSMICLNESNYTDFVKPGFIFTMHVTMKKLILNTKKCPRGCDKEDENLDSQESQCHSCGLRYLSGIIETLHPKEVDTSLVAYDYWKKRLLNAKLENPGPLRDKQNESRACVAQRVSLQLGTHSKYPKTDPVDQEKHPDHTADSMLTARDKYSASLERSINLPPQQEELEEKSEFDELQYFKRVHIKNVAHPEKSGKAATDEADTINEGSVVTENIDGTHDFRLTNSLSETDSIGSWTDLDSVSDRPDSPILWEFEYGLPFVELARQSRRAE